MFYNDRCEPRPQTGQRTHDVLTTSTGPARARPVAMPPKGPAPARAITVTSTSVPTTEHVCTSTPLATATRTTFAHTTSGPCGTFAAPASAARSAPVSARCLARVAAPSCTPNPVIASSTTIPRHAYTVATPRSSRVVTTVPAPRTLRPEC